jgi:Thioredoxin
MIRAMVTPERFAQGMTFDEYVAYTGTPENLAREAGWWLGRQRKDLSDLLRMWHRRVRLSDAQIAAVKWLAAQPSGPAKILVISEEWSSDCRRDVPMLAQLADAGGLDLKIFVRDGTTLGTGPRADPARSPNADIVNAYLNEKNGETFQSIPIAVFFTSAFRELYRYVEFPAIYHKERLANAMQAPKPGETTEQAWARFMDAWAALQRDTPFFAVWASAAIDEMLSALHERAVVGAIP